jgi:hypothetical protein
MVEPLPVSLHSTVFTQKKENQTRAADPGKKKCTNGKKK